MERRRLRFRVLQLVVAGVAVLAIGAVAVHAQTGGGYDLSWSTVDGGGGTVDGGGYALQGTVGQPDAGPALTGGGYALAGGFWLAGGAPPQLDFLISLPLVLRD